MFHDNHKTADIHAEILKPLKNKTPSFACGNRVLFPQVKVRFVKCRVVQAAHQDIPTPDTDNASLTDEL